MPYVSRDPEGQIIALHANRHEEAQEELAPDDADLLAFLGTQVGTADVREALAASDLQLVRVLEDLIAVLIDNGILKLTDLPLAAQKKLALRGELRSRMGGLDDMVAEPEEVLLP